MTQKRWWISVPEAKAIQLSLRSQVICSDDVGEFETVVGIDVGISRKPAVIRAAAAVFRYPEMELIESSVACRPLDFPYVPGYLSFRELPAALQALDALKTRPDIALVDGHGLAHPRRFGLACHLGVIAELPTIGVGKTRFVGTFADPPDVRGAWTPLQDQTLDKTGTETIGAVLRTRIGVRPIFVSIGHRVSLGLAVKTVLACTSRYRLPETTRAADRLAARR